MLEDKLDQIVLEKANKKINFLIKQTSCNFAEWLNTNKYIADPFPEENGKYLYRNFEHLEKKGESIEQLFDKFQKHL